MDAPRITLLRQCQLLLISPRLWGCVLHSRIRYAASWLVALAFLGLTLHFAWTAFDAREPDEENRRRDGNGGHATIDFGGQWLMGKMLERGHSRQLYNRNFQRWVLQDAYPREDQPPSAKKSDVENLMFWMMGNESREATDTAASLLTPLAAPDPVAAACYIAVGRQEWTEERLNGVTTKRVGGPLYPPVNAFLSYPLAFLRPQNAYHVHQCVSVLLTFLAGLAVRYTTGGRIWWPVAIAVIAIYPGALSSLQLGQNAMLTLTIVLWGWAFIARGSPGCGGMVWGLLVFKPVWAAAFFLVPLLTGRWRTCVTMAGTGLLLALATIPVVGLQGWFDWLQVGKDAAELYKTDENWIFLSRDLLSIPRRWLVDFSPEAPVRVPYPFLTAALGWTLHVIVLVLTLPLVLSRRGQAREVEGPAPAFLLLAAWMSCFHFMYYDVLLTVLAFFVLFAEPRRFLERSYVAIVRVPESLLETGLARYYEPRLPAGPPSSPPVLYPGNRNLWVLNRMLPTLLVVLLLITYAFPGWNEVVRWGRASEVDWIKWSADRLSFTGVGEHFGWPYDTFCLMALWAWCGWLWLRRGKSALPAGGGELPGAGFDSGKDSANQPEVEGERLASQRVVSAKGMQR